MSSFSITRLNLLLSQEEPSDKKQTNQMNPKEREYLLSPENDRGVKKKNLIGSY
jgi:hypothetical protein